MPGNKAKPQSGQQVKCFVIGIFPEHLPSEKRIVSSLWNQVGQPWRHVHLRCVTVGQAETKAGRVLG